MAFLVSLPADEPQLVDLESNPGCSAAYLQLSDLVRAAAAGRLLGKDLLDLLKELCSYLRAQERRFRTYPDLPERPEFALAVAQIGAALVGLRTLVEEAIEKHDDMTPTDWASLLEDGAAADEELRQGVEQLDLVEA